MPGFRRYWRVAGLLSVAGAAALAAVFPMLLRRQPSLLFVTVYGGALVLLLAVTVYVAFLDIRFTRLQFKMGERALFRDTFMDPEFRRSLLAQQVESSEVTTRLPETLREEEAPSLQQDTNESGH